MKIGLDIDGVLAAFEPDYGELLVEVSGRNLLPKDFHNGWQPTTWFWERELGYTKEEEAAVWKVIQSSPDFWFNLAPLCPEVNLADLCEKEEVYFITHRKGGNVKAQTEDWLRMVYDIETPTVLLSGNKGPLASGLDLDIFVDDRDKNLWAVKGARRECECYVINYPYNLNVVPSIAKRIESLAEIVCQGHMVGVGC